MAWGRLSFEISGLLAGALFALPAAAQMPFQGPASADEVEPARQPAAPKALERDLAFVSVLVQGQASPDILVTYDGEPLPVGSLGVPLACMPGRHELQAISRDLASPLVVLELRAGAVETVILTLTPTDERATPSFADSTPALAPTSAPQGIELLKSRERAGTRPFLIAAWTSVGVAATAFTLGTLFWAQTPHSEEADALFAGCSPDCNPAEKSQIIHLDERANARARHVSIGGFGVGGASLAAAGLLFWLDHVNQTQPREHLGLTPILAPGYAGLRGRF